MTLTNKEGHIAAHRFFKTIRKLKLIGKKRMDLVMWRGVRTLILEKFK